MIQLGVDYQGGTEEIYRCVKMKVELGRGWQSGANEFNTNALKQLNALRGDETGSVGKEKSKKAAKVNVTDCVICECARSDSASPEGSFLKLTDLSFVSLQVCSR